MQFNLILGAVSTRFVRGTRITCHGSESGACDLDFPHRMGSDGCYYNEDDRHCEACLNEACEYHDFYGYVYDEREEALTVGERNPSLAGRYV